MSSAAAVAPQSESDWVEVPPKKKIPNDSTASRKWNVDRQYSDQPQESKKHRFTQPHRQNRVKYQGVGTSKRESTSPLSENDQEGKHFDLQPSKLAKILQDSTRLDDRNGQHSPIAKPSVEDLQYFLRQYCPSGGCDISRCHPQVQIVHDISNKTVELVSSRTKNDVDTHAVRSANNFLKSILFSRCIPRDKILLDLGCGRGQDMYKLQYAKPDTVLFVDISERSLYEAERRWRKNKYPFPATFVQEDFCSPKFLQDRDVIVYQENQTRRKGEQRTPTKGRILCTRGAHEMVDVVSCQFAAHYAFHSPEAAKQFVDNVCKVLKPGGVFIGTAPQGEIVSKILDGTQGEQKYDRGKYALWLDEEYKTTASDGSIQGSYIPYWFYMKNTIQTKQWTMCFSELLDLFEKRGMKMIYMNNMARAYETEIINPKNAGVAQRTGTKLQDLDDDDWANIKMYCMFAFVKNE
jgi:mRNA (guanine-N7-)-methyltransferase